MLLWTSAASSHRRVHRRPPLTDKPVTAHAQVSAPSGNPVHNLVARIATGDRSAFQDLYSLLGMRVRRDASHIMPHPVDSQAVTRSTFVEIWHLARYHVDDRPRADDWITAITAHKIEERLHTLDTPSLLREDYDRHIDREFTALMSGREPQG